MKKIIAYTATLCLLGCQQQDHHKCGKENALAQVKHIPEVEKAIKQYTKTNQQIVFQIDEGIYEDRKYYIIKEEQEGKFHNSVWNIFYVDVNTCSVYYYETSSGDLLTLNRWRSKNNPFERKVSEKVRFTDLFNEGTEINFTPDELNSNNEKIRRFKKKLKLYESQHPSASEFNTDNLFYLINNDTYFDSQHYTDSNWLKYFLDKYKIKAYELTGLMNLAIRQEDYRATKILMDNGYLVSKADLNVVRDTESEVESKIRENMNGDYKSYVIANSKIKEIAELLREKHLSNRISDPDGFTNLRKDKNTTSAILQILKSGAYVEVLDNAENWILVKTAKGKMGYVYWDRIKMH
ncbi:SH3 domain-containing protein [Pedobacter agri]|uniref:SH3 domain-containing protein n=1 Tax=Pedobacter agri TaxID=454586 RepID=UPI00292E6AC4|nr:SH3 domain-containing protein [Pedobacter agri]